MTEAKQGLELLREPFPAHQISKLPKPKDKNSPKGKCSECGGWHGLPAVHLDYVGHAALTDRLLNADPMWTWEPLAIGKESGLPVIDEMGGLWIRLTVCGVTRLGYGDAGEKTGPNAIKEAIGDALRNAAMRFGAALDLWHKGTLHGDKDDAEDLMRKVADAMIEKYGAGNAWGAYEEYATITDNEHKLAVWGMLKPHSALRAAVKQLGEVERQKQEEMKKAKTGALA